MNTFDVGNYIADANGAKGIIHDLNRIVKSSDIVNAFNTIISSRKYTIVDDNGRPQDTEYTKHLLSYCLAESIVHDNLKLTHSVCSEIGKRYGNTKVTGLCVNGAALSFNVTRD